MVVSLQDIKLTPKTLILGIGNILKQDDGIGPLFVKALNEKIKLHLLDAGCAPENYVGKIARLDIDKIIIIDAIDFGEEAGSFQIIEINKLMNESFATHGISLKMFIEYLKGEVNKEIIVIGIQPEKVSFGQELSIPMNKALNDLTKIFIKLYKDNNKV